MSERVDKSLNEKFAKIRLLVCDVDGVLTDGRLTYSDGGESVKTFHARDGLGFRMLMENNVEVAIITARSGAAVAKRMSDLRIEHVAQGRHDKRAALQELVAQLDIPLENTAYIGDDIIDLPALRLAGLALAPRDAHPVVLNAVDHVTSLGGGMGAVRQIADHILECQVGLEHAIETVLLNVALPSVKK